MREAAGDALGLLKPRHPPILHVVEHARGPRPSSVLAIHQLLVALLVETEMRLQRLEEFATTVIRGIRNEHHVAHIDPHSLLADRGTRESDGLCFKDHDIRAQLHVCVIERKALGATVHGSLPIRMIPIPRLRDPAQQRTAADNLVVPPSEHWVAGRPRIREIEVDAGSNRLEPLVRRELSYTLERRQIAHQLRELALVVVPSTEIASSS
ncbi:hypothetical protein X551_04617 [Methylibium sp. T29]|nr:hypothetical protein X551_04617 [Methylibium sp. T29]